MATNNHLMGIVCLFLVLVLGSALPAQGETVLPCPESAGLCIWNGQGWENLWSSSSSVELVDYESVGKYIVLLLRGHMDPGRLVLLDRKGDVRLIRDLITGRGLFEVTGMMPNYGLVLCNGTIGSALCDTLLLTESMSQLPVPLALPDNCVFPRFLKDRFACIRDWPEPAIVTGMARQRPQVSLLGFEEAKWIENFHALSSGGFLIEAADSAFGWKEGSAIRLSEGEVIWSRQTAPDQVALAQCQRSPDQQLRDCSVLLVGASLRAEEIWSDPGAVPTRLSVLDGGSFLIDVLAGEQRRLILLKRDTHGFCSRQVWGVEAPEDLPRESSCR